MLEICVDRRKIKTTPCVEAERVIASVAPRYLEVRLLLARALHEVDVAAGFHQKTCSSIVQYGARFGLPAADVRMLVDIGRALAARKADGTPVPVEECLRNGTLTQDNAALLGKVVATLGPEEPVAEWLAKAQNLPTHALRRDVNERIEQKAQGVTELVPVMLHVTEKARTGFARARVIASREAEQFLTEGQTFALIVNHFLDAKDELRRGEKARRVGDTAERPEDRYIPASVKREVLERSGDHCEVPGCALTTFLENAHIEAHADHGSRESDNILRLCSRHHTHLDADVLRFGGWGEDGRPRFLDVHGALLTQRTLAQAPRGFETRPGSGDPGDRAVQEWGRPPP